MVSPQTTHKAVPDEQNIVVPGYSILVQTKNLGGDIVPQIQVQALDQVVNTKYLNTTGVGGKVNMSLETGSVLFTAFWNNVSIGELTESITGDSTVNIVCRLANLNVKVQNKDGVPISFSKLSVDFQYVTANGTAQQNNYSGETDALGIFIVNSTLPGIDYFIRTSLYGRVFSNNTVSLPSVAYYTATIVCPSESLSIRTLDYKGNGLQNLHLELVEQTSGIFYNSQTDSAGVSAIDVTFGQYAVRVYKGNVLLNETVISVFGNAQSDIHCVTYNLQVPIKVIDYFGNSIPNINVELSGPSYGSVTKPTQANGVATFDNVIGGNMQITAFSPGSKDSYITAIRSIASPASVSIRMSGYVSLGPILLETTLFTALILILSAVAVFFVIEIYRRKSSSENNV